MVSNIFLKELQSNLLNSRIIATWIILILVFTISTLTSSVYTASSNSNLSLIEQESNSRLAYDKRSGFMEELKAKFFKIPYEKKNKLYSLPYIKQELVKKESALSFISGGGGNIPDGSEMEYFQQPSIKVNRTSNIYLDNLYSLNWSKIFIHILSFVVLCFSYNAFSGEKESGTLKLMLTNNLSRSTIIIGKYLGLLVTFLIPLLIALIIVLIIVMVNPNLAFHEGDAMKISFFMVAGIIFISINIMLGYLISCLSRSSSVSLSVSLIIWTIIAIIYPNISWLGVNKLKPIPTVAQVNDEIKKKQDNLSDCFSGWNSDWRNKEPNKKVLKRKDCWDRKNKIENDLWRDYYLKLFSQTETAINIASLSPFSSFQFLCDKITDNGFYGYRNFRNQVTNYQDEYKSFIKAKDKEDKESYHTFWSESYYAESFMSNKPVNSDEIPKFDYKPASISSILKSSAWNIAYLTVWLLLLYGGVFIAFIRYDVR